jgi:hypothetical protein
MGKEIADVLLRVKCAPVEPVEDERAVAVDDEAADVEDGWTLTRKVNRFSCHWSPSSFGGCESVSTRQ